MPCLPLYLKDVRQLYEKHTAAYDNFMCLDFMALEQTYNKEGKTSLWKRITQSPATGKKYVKTALFLTKISESVKDMAQLWQTTFHHHGESARQVLGDRKLVENIREIEYKKLVNPFTSTHFDDLINIAPGEKASSLEVIKARDLGLKATRKAEEEKSAKLVPPNLTTCFSRKKSALKSSKSTEMTLEPLFFFQFCDDQTGNIAFSHEWTK